MKNSRLFLAVAVLVLASLACKTVMGGGSGIPNVPSGPSNSNDGSSGGEATSVPSDGGGTSIGSNYPMPSDATNVVSASGTTTFQTKMTLDDAMAFYRDEYGKLGFTENTTMSVTTSKAFTLVFDGDSSGKSIYIAGVDLGDGTSSITITLQ